MKKILLAAMTASLMSISAMAATLGTVSTLQIDSEGLVKMRILKDADASTTKLLPVVGADTKTMIAMLLTAKSAGTKINASISVYNDVQGWSQIIME